MTDYQLVNAFRQETAAAEMWMVDPRRYSIRIVVPAIVRE